MIDNVIQLQPSDDQWGEPFDVMTAKGYTVPLYTTGMLPKVFEDMALAKCSFYRDNSMELYAGAFAGAVAAHLPSDVKVELVAGSLELTHGVVFSGFVAASGEAKTPIQDSALGYKGDHEPLREWDASIQDVGKALYVEARAKNGGKTLKKEDCPAVPCLVTNDFTMEALIDALATNSKFNIPLNVICGEPFNLFTNGQGDTTKPNGKVLDNLKEIWDNKPVKLNRVTRGIISAESTVMNAFFCTTPDQFRNWIGLPIASRDGTMARFDLYTSSGVNPTEAQRTLDMAPIKAWHVVQHKLHKLKNINCLLAPDEELRKAIDALSAAGGDLGEGHDYGKWLRKAPTRFARLTMFLFLVDLVQHPERFEKSSLPHKYLPEGRTYVIPTEYQWRAYNFLKNFMWLHQRTIYQHVLVSDRTREYLQNTLLKLLRWKDATIPRDEVCGSKAPGTIGPDKDDRVHNAYAEKLIEMEWIQATSSRQYIPEHCYDPKAKLFAISPRLNEAYAKHKATIDARNQLLYGEMGIVAKIKMGLK